MKILLTIRGYLLNLSEILNIGTRWKGGGRKVGHIELWRYVTSTVIITTMTTHHIEACTRGLLLHREPSVPGYYSSKSVPQRAQYVAASVGTFARARYTRALFWYVTLHRATHCCNTSASLLQYNVIIHMSLFKRICHKIRRFRTYANSSVAPAVMEPCIILPIKQN